MTDNQNPLVSVIVPVYKTELFLVRCLETIINQSLRNIEIIIIDDGSPDNSNEIIKEYYGKDNRVVSLAHDNIGLGMTRNRGIRIARGKYLAFVDSDDFIEHNMLELMYRKAEAEELDVVVCETYIEEKEKSKIAFAFEESSPNDLSGINIDAFFRDAVLNNKYRYCAWNKLYKRNFIIENNIVFGDNNRMYAEDLHFQFYLLNKYPRINFLPIPLYHYIQREDSITGSVRKNYIKRHLYMIEGFYDTDSLNGFKSTKLIDCVLFRGLLNEAKYCKAYQLNFSEFQKSIAAIYKSPAYERFIDSVKKNKSYKLISFKKRRQLFIVFFYLQLIGMKVLSEFILYSVLHSK